MDLNYNEIHGKDKGRWMETPKKNLFLKKKIVRITINCIGES